MDEFEKIENECNNQNKPKQTDNYRKVFQPDNSQNKRKKKLFDDSESDQSDQEEPHEVVAHQNAYDNETGGRSNLVNKMFYKDQQQQPQSHSRK